MAASGALVRADVVERDLVLEDSCSRMGVDPDLASTIKAAGDAACEKYGMPDNPRDFWESELWSGERGVAQLRWLKQRALSSPEAIADRAYDLCDDEEFVAPLLEEHDGWLPSDRDLVELYYDGRIAAYEARVVGAHREVVLQRRRSPRVLAPVRRLVLAASRGGRRGRGGRSRRRRVGSAHGPPGRSTSDDPGEPPDVDLDIGVAA